MDVNRFSVDRSLRSNANFPHFGRPKVIGYFSLDENKKFMPNAAQLRYLVRSSDITTELDLKQGYHLCKQLTTADEQGLESLLRWILLNTPKIRADQESDRWLQPHFVCFRGLLTTICCTPFERQEGWIFSASKWRGTIYLNRFLTEEAQHAKNNYPESLLQFMAWGYKFEQYLLSESPGQIPDTSQAVNAAPEFDILFKSRLAEHKLLYAAEIDGVESDEILAEPIDWDKKKLVELKTCRIIEDTRRHRNFRRYKLIKWWCQSFLVGIENVICGFRDDNGIVKHITSFEVAEMARMSKEFWTGSECMNFAADFLNFVKSVVKEDYDKSVYKFEWAPGRDVQVKVFPGKCEYSALPQWFINNAEPYNRIS
ncbi:decapping and exoribonuclease protein-like [Athalia rosae]|uniref:decapping and exoribonuclease protein-like n=1 Tax=Athalia rosae TaxID=37344 RepID=UPI0020337C23|nr:decapping and exoribonuclease protein-like [Athalia rosae]